MLESSIALLFLALAVAWLVRHALKAPRPGHHCNGCSRTGGCHGSDQGTQQGSGDLRILPLLLLALVAVPTGAEMPVDGAGNELDLRSPPPELGLEHGTTSDSDEPEQLLGGMGGLRPWLDRFGLSLELVTVDEGLVAGQPDSSDDPAQHYAGLTDLVLSLETAGAGWWQGGRLVVDLQNVRGGDLSAALGDSQGVSNIVGPPGTRLVEYYLEQTAAKGRLTLKIGKQDANADFVVSDGGGELLNSSFGLIPTVPLPTFPAPALGVMARWQAADRLAVKAGIWDGAAEVGSGCVGSAFDGTGGTVAAAGVELSSSDRWLPGTYRLGVWHHSEVELSASAKLSRGTDTAAATGLYLTADQVLWSGPSRSVSAFAQGGWSESDRSAVSSYAGGGVILRGLLSNRPDDVAGLAIAHAEIGEVDRQSPACESETVLELFYRVAVTPWLELQPDLQLVDDPGGAKGRGLVFGIRMTTRL